MLNSLLPNAQVDPMFPILSQLNDMYQVTLIVCLGNHLSKNYRPKLHMKF